MHGNTEEEFRTQLQMKKMIAEQKRINPSLISENEAAKMFKMTPFRFHMLMAKGLSLHGYRGSDFLQP